MKLSILFFTITIIKRRSEERTQEELHALQIQRRLAENKLKHMIY